MKPQVLLKRPRRRKSLPKVFSKEEGSRGTQSEAQLRYSSARERSGYKVHTRVIRSQEHQDDRDIHTCKQEESDSSAESDR